MVKNNKKNLGFIIIIITLFTSTLYFYYRWQRSSNLMNLYNIDNDKFDSIYNSNDGFRDNIDFLKKNMLFKINNIRKAIENNNYNKKDNFVYCKNTLDSLRYSLLVDEGSLNEILRHTSKKDTIIIFRGNFLEKIKNIKVEDGKAPFILILDTLESRINEIKSDVKMIDLYKFK